MNQLHKHTQMQESFSMIFLAVHNGQPKELALDQAIRAFLDHRVEVVRRRTAFLLAKAREREHVLLGLPDCVGPSGPGDPHHSAVGQPRSKRGSGCSSTFQRASRSTCAAPGLRMKSWPGSRLDPAKYGVDMTFSTTGTLILSYRQVDAILELQLYRLTQLSIDELLKELGEVRAKYCGVRVDLWRRRRSCGR